ncbi:inorganic phosphate transporter [Jonesiaceae bacterium BS-20]|uniref:Inorganic phosphate transporter n=1 Tax=Jonesiaceae bacterium BS-20 TaxID=3120821 RepID=A0AAU7DWA2_9MICO
MELAIGFLAVALIILTGRNDGSTLAATALKGDKKSDLFVLITITVCVPIAPLLGLHGVASSLSHMLGPLFGEYTSTLGFLGSVLITLGISVALSVPTSITLALVGALTGTLLGTQGSANLGLVGRVLTIAAIAPLVAALVSYLISKAPLKFPNDPQARGNLLNRIRGVSITALAIAYSINDGQKITFIAAATLQLSITQASTSIWVQISATLLFAAGMLWGLRKAERTLRNGIFSPTPLPALWSQIGTIVALSGGAALGTPLSMTQSLQGAVLGTGLVRGTRVIRWPAVGKIAIAWLWTLPLATALAYGFSFILN